MTCKLYQLAYLILNKVKNFAHIWKPFVFPFLSPVFALACFLLKIIPACGNFLNFKVVSSWSAIQVLGWSKTLFRFPISEYGRTQTNFLANPAFPPVLSLIFLMLYWPSRFYLFIFFKVVESFFLFLMAHRFLCLV